MSTPAICNVYKILIYSLLVFGIIILGKASTSIKDYEDSFMEDTQLVMTFMIFRHGDRAPVELTLQYVTDIPKVTTLIQKSGFGQLTDAGKRRGYRIGEFIRRRYDAFLSPQYNQSEIYIRSTDSARAKMTVLTAMAAVYPVVDSWCEDMKWCEENNWTPVPYTTENPKHDFNLPFVNCPKYVTAYRSALNGPAPQMEKYSEFLNQWSKIIGINITQQPSKAFLIHDAYASQLSLGVPLGPEIEKILPKIEEVAGAGIDVVFGDDRYISLGAGVLLKEFFDAANKIIAGEDVPKVYVYSAHDANVYSFMAVTKIKPRVGVPKYGAVYALELRRVVETGQYIVMPVYLKTPEDAEVVYLQVEGCEGLCDLSTFHELVSEYELNQKEWKSQCEWSEEFDFDLELIV